jgi:hypothetical protein
LFAGVSARAERLTRQRARLLEKRLNTSGRRSDQLLRLLGEIAPDEESKLAACALHRQLKSACWPSTLRIAASATSCSKVPNT